MTINYNFTETDAVNKLLGAIGERGISDIATTDFDEALEAQKVLHSVCFEVLGDNYLFNKRILKLTPNSSTKEITVPGNVIRINNTDWPYFVAIHGTKLFDTQAQSYEFDKAVTVSATVGMQWDELPYSAKNYIATRASRIFMETWIGSEVKSKELKEKELITLAALQQENISQNGNFNVNDRNSKMSIALGMSYTGGRLPY